MHYAQLQVICLEKRRILIETFVESQFNYCPLIWMLHSRTLNNRINRYQESIVYSDYKLSFNILLGKDGSFSIHNRNIQSLAIGINFFMVFLQLLGRHYETRPASYTQS